MKNRPDDKEIRLLALIAFRAGEISEGRAVELTGFSRNEIRDEMHRRCGKFSPYTEVSNELEALKARIGKHETKTASIDTAWNNRKPTDIPINPGYYWAKWRIPADDTHEASEMCKNDWEIVQVNANRSDWLDDPAEPEALGVAVHGVRETQWRDCFFWGDFVAAFK